ncbi:MAG: hypothetical protein AB7P21_29810 [Lautropia sp.]
MSIRLLLVASLLWCVQAIAGPMPRDQVPEALRDWVPWVLHANPDAGCPVRFDADVRECVWAGSLDVAIDARGASFRQTVSAFRDTRFTLPGDTAHWPTDVVLDGEPARWVADKGRPVLALDAGEHTISGRIAWTREPQALALNPATGIVRASRDGRPLAAPEIREGRFWLSGDPAASAGRAPEDALRLVVNRALFDGHPLVTETHLKLEVAGSQREVVLGRPVPSGFIALSLASPLPARLDPDGRLRVQVRPGAWEIRVRSRHPGPVERIAHTPQPEPWPADETWVYRSAPGDRITEVGGAPQVDPRRTSLPDDWRNLPAWQLSGDAALTIRTIRRGNPEPEPDQLKLERELWLDFDGGGYSVRDRIDGALTRSWRLEAAAPLLLGQVDVDRQPQFITTSAGSSAAGVEVRQGRLDLSARARLEGDIGRVPMPGWALDFRQASATLYTPPGWRLLAVGGADSAPGAWVERWTLLDLFFVLIIVIAVARLWRWTWALPVAVGLVLTWHEPDAPQGIWLALLAAVALLRAVPPAGRISGVLRVGRLLLLVVLAVQLLPFLVAQARLGLYPQLELRHGAGAVARVDTGGGAALERAEDAVRAPREAMSPAPSGKPLARGGGRADPMSPYAPSLAEAWKSVDPNAVVQTGEGLPDWRWQRNALGWSGPLPRDQVLELYLLAPWQTSLARWVGLLLLVILAWRVLDVGRGSANPPAPGGRGLRPWFAAAIAAYAGGAVAADFPPPELLQQLSERLLAQPVAAPRAAIQAMRVEVGDDRLQATLDVQALATTAIPLPIDPAIAVPMAIDVDGRPANARVMRTAKGEVWLLLDPGRHSVRIVAAVPAIEQLQLPLPLPPQRVDARADGWRVQGLDPEGVPRGQLSFTRESRTQERPRELTPGTLPPFLVIERTLSLGLQWQVQTVVRRVSPTGTALSARVPLLPGESVITQGRAARDGSIDVAMSADAREVSWVSFIEPVDRLTLRAGDDPQWLETWRADISPIWHAELSGIAPIHHQDAQRRWLPAWHPWPGEEVGLTITRPQGVPGRTSSIDRSRMVVRPGDRATESELGVVLRSSQGGRHTMQLPGGAQLQWVKIDGRAQAIRLGDDGRLTVPVSPGEQKIDVLWRDDGGIGASWRTPAPDLGSPHANASLRVEPPADRWVLWVRGPTLGPAVLFWGLMVVLVLLAAVLGAAGARRMPLGFVSWLLLGLGLAQLSVLALLPVALWLFLLHDRAGLDDRTSKTRFNVTQAAIVFLTLVSFAVLFGAIERGLLGTPDMQITGNGSSAGVLNWYQDRSAGRFPEAHVLSVPMFVYRALMLAWALWLAFSLLRWLRWGWAAFSKGGLWRSVRLGSRWRGGAKKPTVEDAAKPVEGDTGAGELRTPA